MVTRKLAVVVAAATTTWAIAVGIAVAIGDIHKLFALCISAAIALTIVSALVVLANTITAGVATAAAAAAERATAEKAREMKSIVIPVPVEMAHSIGFKQGWQAREVQHLNQLSPVLANFERYFPSPPN